jgi:hypothetical protein
MNSREPAISPSVRIGNQYHFCLGFVLLLMFGTLYGFGRSNEQDVPPKLPPDQTQVYIADSQGQLSLIPFETGRTPLKPLEVARDDKTSYVEVPGENSKTVISTSEPRIYLFVSDQPNTHPAFLVQFIRKKGARRVPALTERGRTGYAIASEQIVKPHYRVLGKQNGMLFMEIRPRVPLVAGEYAIMGSDLSRVATFSIGR